MYATVNPRYDGRGFPVPQRPPEDRIQQLAVKALAAIDPAELDDIIQQLRAALHELKTRMQKQAGDGGTRWENIMADDVAAE
jgi:hypothetical protein